MGPGHRILLISGSLRAGSASGAALATLTELLPVGVETELYGDLGELPHFNPDDDPAGGEPPVPVAALRARLGAADAIVFSTPEYAGALPGSFKNLLDWSVGGGETYGKPVAWVNTAGPAAPSGGDDAHDSLRKVLRYTGAEIVAEACVRVPVTRGAIGPDGRIADGGIREALAAAGAALIRDLDARWGAGRTR